MKSIQLTGPFYNGYRIEVEPKLDRKYVHIGIQMPRRQPAKYAVKKNGEFKDLTYPRVILNDDKSHPYIINENGILEFDGTSWVGYTIEFQTDSDHPLPRETIVDIVYSDALR